MNNCLGQLVSRHFVHRSIGLRIRNGRDGTNRFSLERTRSLIKLLVVCIFSVMASTTVTAADTFPRLFTMQLDHNDSTSMSGEVIDLNGESAAHAKIAVFVTHPYFMVPVLGPTLLHECTADSVGRFTFKFASPSAFQCTSLYAIAGHSLHGFTQVELDLPRRSHEIVFRLKKEQAIQGQVVGPEGQKVKGLEIDLVSVSDKQTYTSFERSSSLPEAWPKSTVTDGEGEFTFRGVYVYPPEGEPYLAWVIDAKRWPTGKSVFDL